MPGGHIRLRWPCGKVVKATATGRRWFRSGWSLRWEGNHQWGADRDPSFSADVGRGIPWRGPASALKEELAPDSELSHDPVESRARQAAALGRLGDVAAAMLESPVDELALEVLDRPLLAGRVA